MDTIDKHDGYLPQGRRMEAQDDVTSNPLTSPTMGEIIARRFGRRDVLKGALATTAVAAIAGPALLNAGEAQAATPSFAFPELTAGVDPTHHVADGYKADILIRWGDPVLAGAPEFDPANQTAKAQAGQFGYNNDFVGFMPLPAGSKTADHGLLVVNHEYTSEDLMFPGRAGKDLPPVTKEQAMIEQAAMGMSVIEVKREGGKWSYVKGAPLNRRITVDGTEMELTGPVAGDARVKTAADPTGTKVFGTMNNCAGGVTPWGTVLTAEENIQSYFGGELPAGHREAKNHKRMGLPSAEVQWHKHFDRFDVAKEPNEPNRFGWMVEIDPYDVNSVPKKRTALGRFKHEGAGVITAKNGKAVAYMGDDQRFDYLYKFVSAKTVNTADRAANFGILDEGTLFVARFDEDGAINWLPLVFGQGPLTAANGFNSQADVLIDTRQAADLLGATPMDRPEDVEAVEDRVYVMLTNNTSRKADKLNIVNTRAENKFGHIVEITVADGDHTGTKDKWSLLVECGNPAKPEHKATFNPATTDNGWFGSPDNCAIDGRGRLWVTTDGNNFGYSGRTDGVWAMETKGELRGTGKLFFRVPVGAEMCGPCFSPDDTALFLAVQHPGEGGKEWPEFGRASTFADPVTRWPDFKDGTPPRPSLVVVSKADGGVIG